MNLHKTTIDGKDWIIIPAPKGMKPEEAMMLRDMFPAILRDSVIILSADLHQEPQPQPDLTPHIRALNKVGYLAYFLLGALTVQLLHLIL